MIDVKTGANRIRLHKNEWLKTRTSHTQRPQQFACSSSSGKRGKSLKDRNNEMFFYQIRPGQNAQKERGRRRLRARERGKVGEERGKNWRSYIFLVWQQQFVAQGIEVGVAALKGAAALAAATAAATVASMWMCQSLGACCQPRIV